MTGAAGSWTAIILAGNRPNENDFAHGLGYPAKALIEVDGEPMLGRVARALIQSPSVGKILILAQDPKRLIQGSLGWMAREPRIATANSGNGISLSILAVAGNDSAPWPLLITTADHALLTPEIVESFIGGARDGDASVALVERQVVEAAYPETKRTWLKFSDGHYTGANLFALRTPNSRKAAEIWSSVERDRKKAMRLFRFFGPLLALRAATRTISVDAALRSAGKRLRIDCRAVRLEIAEAAIDVDKLADLQLVQHIIARRKKTAEA